MPKAAFIGKILTMVINPLYLDRDIFVREPLLNEIHRRKFIVQTKQAVFNTEFHEIFVVVA